MTIFRELENLTKRVKGFLENGRKYLPIKNPIIDIGNFKQIKELVLNAVLIEKERILCNCDLSEEMLNKISNALDKLAESYSNLQVHKKVWAEYSYLFPHNYIPPIRIPQNFCTEDFDLQTLEAMKKSMTRFNHISHPLWKYKVPCDYKKGIEYLEGSELKRILDSVDY